MTATTKFNPGDWIKAIDADDYPGYNARTHVFRKISGTGFAVTFCNLPFIEDEMQNTTSDADLCAGCFKP